MERYSDDQLNYAKKGRTSEALAYTAEFKKELSETQNLILFSKKAIDQMIKTLKDSDSEEKVEAFESSDVSVAYIGRNQNLERAYFKVTNKVNNYIYFVKVSAGPDFLHGGPEELFVTEQLKTDLGKLKGVRVTESKLGYRDENRAYYVSKYEQAIEVALNEKLLTIKKVDEEKYKDLIERYNAIICILHSTEIFKSDRRYGDVMKNIGYDEVTDEFIVFDLIMYAGETDNKLHVR